MSDDPNIVHGEGSAPSVPNVSLGEFLMMKLQAHKNQIAQVDYETGDTLTFSQILSRSILVAQHMRRLGIRQGDVVGISSENNLDYCLPIIASQLIGAVFAPFNPSYTEGELLHSMSISRPRIVYASAATIKRVSTASKELDCVRDIVLIGRDCASYDVPSHLRISDFLLRPIIKASEFVPTRICNTRKETAIILCSSGTTGLPKGVELTHHNFLTFLFNMSHTDVYKELCKDNGSIPGMLPFYHGYGFGMLLLGINMGTPVVVLSRFDEGMFLQIVQDYKISVLFLVPPLVVFLGKHPMVENYDLSHVRIIVCGAAPLSKESQDLVRDRLGVKDFRQAYGMTETSILASHNPTKAKMGSSGYLVGGTSAKIIDVETGKSLPRYKEGEICIKGPHIMKGYRNNSKATMETIDEDGWLHTGDIGYFDNDGCLFIVDRLKELIKYKGFQVAPAELEAILYTHKEIRDAGVVGVTDELCGELPVAFVVRQPNSTLTEKDVMDYVAARVSPQKKLRGGVRFVSEIPRNPSGKILRRVLRSKL